MYLFFKWLATFLTPKPVVFFNKCSPYLAEAMRPGSKLSDFQGRLFIIGFLILVRRQMMVAVWSSWSQKQKNGTKFRQIHTVKVWKDFIYQWLHFSAANNKVFYITRSCFCHTSKYRNLVWIWEKTHSLSFKSRCKNNNELFYIISIRTYCRSNWCRPPPPTEGWIQLSVAGVRSSPNPGRMDAVLPLRLRLQPHSVFSFCIRIIFFQCHFF